MRPNLLKEREMEKKTDDKPTQQQTAKEEALPEPEEIFISKKNDAEEPIKPTMPKINLFSSATFEKHENVAFQQKIEVETEKTTPQIQEQQSIQQENIEEPEKQTEKIERDFFEINAKPKQKRKPTKFRFRLLTCIYCAIIAVCSGWVITNAVRISTMQSNIEASQTSFSINELKYIKKIEQLDDLKNSSQNPDDSSLLPIEEIITIQPSPLENPTDYAQNSNWFDKICNWFGHLFGG